MAEFDSKLMDLADMVGEYKIKYQKDHNLSSTAAYNELEDICEISADTIKKSISGRLKVSRVFLYKFTLGLKMNEEEANELFSLCGGPLSENNKEDFICMHALRDKDSVKHMVDEFDKFLKQKIGLRARSDTK